jgi:hypothetical protein
MTYRQNRAAATKTTATLVPEKIMPYNQTSARCGQSTSTTASPAVQTEEIKRDDFEFASFGRIASEIRFHPFLSVAKPLIPVRG